VILFDFQLYMYFLYWCRRDNICKRCYCNCWSHQEKWRWCYGDTYKWEVILNYPIDYIK